MRAVFSVDNKIASVLILAVVALAAFVIAYYAEAAKRDASVSLQREPGVGLFILTIRDPDGIREFSLQPPGKPSYGGEVKCPASFSSKNIVFDPVGDFTPAMNAYVIDCAGNRVEFELPPLDEKGFTRGKIVGPEEEKPVSLPTPPAAPPSAPPPPPTKSLVDVEYPIQELGNCTSQEACIAYCDDSAHINECIAFAKKHNLLSGEELQKAEKFAAAKSGPGGCTSQESCEAYCSNINRMDECLEWAEKNGFISGDELEEAKKVQAAVKAGAKLPGGCTNKQSCEAYCTDPNNIDECLAFAEASGFLPKEEIEQAKKFAEFMKKGETPGGCRSKEQCEAYCFEGDRMEECVAFAEKAGMISPEEIDIIRKTGGKGPGGCKGKVQCEAYCSAPEHQEECFYWAQGHGLMKEEDLTRMREGMERFKEEFSKMPPEVAECLKNTIGEGILNKMLSGEPVFAKDLGEKMQACFATMLESFGGGFGGSEGGLGGPEGGFRQEGFSGPGGCSNPEECFKYCMEHQDECKNFAPPAGVPGMEPGGFPSGPGIPPGFVVPQPGEGLIQPSTPPPSSEFPRPSICPMMPTVESCPSGQHRVEVFRSEACGIYYACVSESPSTSPPPGGTGGFPGICPAMPTVESCPPGYRKAVAFSSPECGTYYTCEPEAGTVFPPPPSSQDPAQECTQQGGTWDPATSYCRFETAPTGLSPFWQGLAGLLAGFLVLLP